ncbi:MAG: aminoglycoside phosphotransferase family protein [Jatrophihabitantaceae bacterium]
MSVPRMHADEVAIDGDLVQSLLREQAPAWTGLPLTRVSAWGTDHVIYRLGDELSVRLPKIGWAASQGETERRWLPLIAAQVAVEVPVPLFVGRPQGGYPYRWYVSPWLAGQNPSPEDDLALLAGDLAAFVLDLQRLDTVGAPRPEVGDRGGPLVGADTSTRECLKLLRGQTDVDALLAGWQAGVQAPGWNSPPRWVHGDLMEGNLLVRRGRLVAVIDWGGCKAGDPAIDLLAAWSLFDEPSREIFRQRLGFVDEPMWLRGRAWAVSAAVQALPYYRDTNPDIVARSWRVVKAVLADLGQAPR